MIRLADIVNRYRDDLIGQYASQLLPSHYAALDAIAQCRTSAIGSTTWRCDDCHEVKTIPLSCEIDIAPLVKTMRPPTGLTDSWTSLCLSSTSC